MFTADVYRFEVRSAGSNQEEYTALKEIEQWNATQGEAKGRVFIPVKPTEGVEADVVIGIVGSYLFDADYFEASLAAGKTVILFFNTFHDTNNSIKSEVEEVEAFRTQMQPRCTCQSYNGTSAFAQALRESLETI